MSRQSEGTFEPQRRPPGAPQQLIAPSEDAVDLRIWRPPGMKRIRIKVREQPLVAIERRRLIVQLPFTGEAEQQSTRLRTSHGGAVPQLNEELADTDLEIRRRREDTGGDEVPDAARHLSRDGGAIRTCGHSRIGKELRCHEVLLIPGPARREDLGVA